MANKTLGTRQKMTFRPASGRQDYRAGSPPQSRGEAAPPGPAQGGTPRTPRKKKN